MKINRKNDLEYITFDNLEQTGLVKHCFTTRHGGVSTDYWASMNMGFARGEEREPVLQDRKSTRLNSSHSQQSRMPSSA